MHDSVAERVPAWHFGSAPSRPTDFSSGLGPAVFELVFQYQPIPRRERALSLYSTLRNRDRRSLCVLTAVVTRRGTRSRYKRAECEPRVPDRQPLCSEFGSRLAGIGQVL